MRKIFAIGLLLLAPAVSLAAGFATQSIFLSKSSVTEGDSVKIYAVLSNNAAAAFTGSVVLSDGATKIGSTTVSIPAGGSQIASIGWKPAAGAHTITAELVSKDGASVEKESQTFTVAEIPKPVVAPAFNALDASSAAVVESSQGIQDQIGSVSPTAANVTKPAFSFLDGIRSTAADFIDSQLTNTKAKLAATPKSGIVAGDSSENGVPNPQIQNPWGSVWTILYTLYIYLLTLLRFVVGNVGVFYPLIAVIFLYFLWRMFKRFRRPAWER